MNVLSRKLRMACAYKARALCNGVFVSGLDPRRLSREDAGYNPFFHLARPRLDRERRSVECSMLGTGLFREKAVHVDGVGAVLLSGTPEEAVRAWLPVAAAAPHSPNAAAAPWPVGEAAAPVPHDSGIDARRVDAAVAKLFDDRGRRNPLRTRALIIVHDGRIICERYAPGFGIGTRLLSWSMAKSAVSVLVGILAGQGRIRVDEPAPVPEWADPGDPRRAITVSQLLRMSSGLAWTESYGEKPISDVTRMLFLEPDMARFAASQPLAEKPDTAWRYSSGSTNIVCRIMRKPVREPRGVPRVPASGAVRPDRCAQRGVGNRCLGHARRLFLPVRDRPGFRPVRHVLPGRRCLAGRADPARGLDEMGHDPDADRPERRIRGRFLAQP